MYLKQNEHTGLTITAAVLLLYAGCVPPVQKPQQLCPGKDTIAQSVESLKKFANFTGIIRAQGRCFAEFIIDGKKQQENFHVNLWINQPDKIRMHGDVFFNPRGIDMGANSEELWLAVKPKELGNNYYWGKWTDFNSFNGLKINPKILLEALSVFNIDDLPYWSLGHEQGFDALKKSNSQAKIIKKIYIDCCSYRPVKIEYFNESREKSFVVELDKYETVCEGMQIPGQIKITNYSSSGKDSLKIVFDSVKLIKLSDRQMNIIFGRPGTGGYQNIYRIIDCKIIEQ